MIPVILSGGSGTRLWPLSREAFPKQFLRLAGAGSMLQETWSRAAPLATALDPSPAVALTVTRQPSATSAALKSESPLPLNSPF